MNNYKLSENEINDIINHYGNEFYNRAIKYINIYAERWQLDSFKLIPYFSINLIFSCQSKTYGEAILKIGNPNCTEITTEIQMLRDYNGGRYCKLYLADVDTGVFLIELIKPGNTLFAEPLLDKRLDIFADLYNGLHIAPINKYPTYLDWIEKGIKLLENHTDHENLRYHINNAKCVYHDVTKSYTQMLLLHGDLHHENILFNGDEYKIIDPKGVIGNPVFDVSRFILNEFHDILSSDLLTEINNLIDKLSNKINVPADILIKCLYIETSIWACWDFDGGVFDEWCKILMNNIAVTFELLN